MEENGNIKSNFAKYSEQIVSFLTSFEHIFDEMSENNLDSKIKIETIEQIIALIE